MLCVIITSSMPLKFAHFVCDWFVCKEVIDKYCWIGSIQQRENGIVGRNRVTKHTYVCFHNECIIINMCTHTQQTHKQSQLQIQCMYMYAHTNPTCTCIKKNYTAYTHAYCIYSTYTSWVLELY